LGRQVIQNDARAVYLWTFARTDRLLDSSHPVDAFPDFPRKTFAAAHTRLRIVRLFLAFALRRIADFCAIEQGNIVIPMFP
jgi:hypothetical protein